MNQIFKILCAAILVASVLSIMPRQQAPDFIATAVMPDLSFKDLRLNDFKGKFVVLLFYPLDFTYVCPT